MTADTTPAEPTRRHIEPLDPDSDKGRAVAARLSVVFADVRQAIAARKHLAAQRATHRSP